MLCVRERGREWVKNIFSLQKQWSKMHLMMYLPNKKTSRLSVNGDFRCPWFVFRLLFALLYELSLASAALPTELLLLILLLLLLLLLLCIAISGETLAKHFTRIKPFSKCELSSCMCSPKTVVTIPCGCTIAGYVITDESYTWLLKKKPQRPSKSAST